VGESYTVPQVLGEIRDLVKAKVDALEADVRAIVEQERLAKGTAADAHFEPGKHEAYQAGAPEHLEPGGHERFELNDPAHPEGQDPVGSGTGVPAGQLGDGDACALCHMPDRPGSCLCLQKAERSPFDGEQLRELERKYGGKSAKQIARAAGRKVEKGVKIGTTGSGEGGALALAEADDSPKSNPGHNGDKTKKQPDKPVTGAVLAPEKTKKIAQPGSGGEPKKNPLGKADVPMAKPPSGKVPGQGKPPMSNPASKPGITNKGELDKASLNPATAAPKKMMQQHMMSDASRAAAKPPAPAGGGVQTKPPLTKPGDMSRANAYGAAAAGEFQPKGPVTSGLELQAPPRSMRGPPAPAVPAVPRAAASPLKAGFLKSERCALCRGPEHAGACPA
jgi:hypothetical protein